MTRDLEEQAIRDVLRDMPAVPDYLGPIAKPTPRPKVRQPLRSKPHVIPTSVREAVFARDEYTCQWCGVLGGALDAHHRFRRAQGGRDVAAHLVSVHRLCHSAIHEQVAEAKRRRFIVSTEAELSEGWR